MAWYFIVLISVIALAILLFAAAAYMYSKTALRPRKTGHSSGGKMPFPTNVDWDSYRTRVKAGGEWFDSMSPENVSIRSRDGLELRGKYLISPASNTTLLLVHGYMSTGFGDFGAMLKSLYESGFNILVIDQRAHGRSDGRYIGFGITERYDCLDWINFISANRPGEGVVPFGISMGAASVLMSAGLGLPDCVKGIIADCGYTSPKEIMNYVVRRFIHVPAFPLVSAAGLIFRLRSGFRLDACNTWSAIQNFRKPILFIHGTDDIFVPPAMTKKNYDSYMGPKELMLVPGAGHAESFLKDDNAYLYTARCFLSSL